MDNDEKDINYEENLPEEIVKSLEVANDTVADLNMTLSHLESVDLLYLDGNGTTNNKAEIYLMDATDFVTEIGPCLPEVYKEMQASEVLEERTSLFEHYVNTLLYELRKQCCEKVKNIYTSLSIPQAYGNALKDIGLDTENATIISLTHEQLEILSMKEEGNESRSILISPNQIDSEYIDIRVNDILDDLKPTWKGFFNGNTKAIDALQRYLKGETEYREFFSEITALPEITIIKEEEDDFSEDIFNSD